MRVEPPLSHEVVLIGGGHTHALFLRQWGMNPVAGARLTVINPEPVAPYTGMLPGFVAGHYRRDVLDIDLVRLARFAGARMVIGRATAIDRVRRRVSVPGRPDVAYDTVSVDIGITSNMAELSGFQEFGVAAKPLGPFASAWEHFAKSGGSVAVIGGGVGGVELALAMRHRLGASSAVSVIEAGTILRGIDGKSRDRLLAELKDADITVSEGAAPYKVTRNTVCLADGREIPSEFTVGAAGARPFEWLQNTGLELHNGFIAVDATLRSVTDPNVYAVGDCAHLGHAPRPKAGVFAVRAAPTLVHNIVADLTGSARKAFRPQSRYLKLISLGRKAAIADGYGIAPKGDWAWRWKDKIDRKFMDRLNDTPDMSVKRHPLVAKSSRVDAPMCGGCGAKVGHDVLSDTLARLDIVRREDVVAGTGDDAAILKTGGMRQVISTDHLRAFWPDPYVMGRIATVHAFNDVLAMGATPQAVLAQITLPRMTDALQSAWLEDCLTAAAEVAKEAGAAIVGGHTTMGAELTVGFTVTGVAEREPLTLAGAQVGDAVVLSREVGSGTLLAAEMKGEAKGADVAACLETMSRLDLARAVSLAEVANAMTDVTGFGLAGHAMQMANASGATLQINMDDVPFYRGAVALADAGIRSTLFDANLRGTSVDAPTGAFGALMFDPQTAGGMLAAVPPNAVTSDMGQIIGQVLPRAATSLIFR